MSSQTPSGRRVIEMTLIGVVGSAVFAALAMGTGSASGDLANFVALSGEAHGEASATGALLAGGDLVGSVSSNESCTGALRADLALAGTVPGGCSVVATMGLAITGAPGAATVGTPYSFTPAVIGGNGPKSFSLSGSLPPGLLFSTTSGLVSGTPSTAGAYSGIIITVSDASGSASLPALTINVAASGSGGSALKLANSSNLLLAGGGRLLLAQG